MFRASLHNGIALRQLEEQHVTEVFERVDRDRTFLRRWLAWVDATETMEDTRLFVSGVVENCKQDRAVTAGVWFRDEFAGVVGTHGIDWVNRRVEIGYWLGEAFQGRGIMTEACRALVDHLLRERELHRIECLCATGNLRSCAIPQRLGFTREGVHREALLLQDTYHDLCMWSMLETDWNR